MAPSIDLFYKLPQDLATRRDITGNDKVIWAVIVDHIGQNIHSWPGEEKIMRKAGVCKATVIASIGRLESAGLLKVERRGNGKVNHYQRNGESGLKTRPVGKLDRSEKQTSTGLKTRPEAVGKQDPNQTDPLNQTTTAAEKLADKFLKGKNANRRRLTHTGVVAAMQEMLMDFLPETIHRAIEENSWADHPNGIANWLRSHCKTIARQEAARWEAVRNDAERRQKQQEYEKQAMDTCELAKEFPQFRPKFLRET